MGVLISSKAGFSTKRIQPLNDIKTEIIEDNGNVNITDSPLDVSIDQKQYPIATLSQNLLLTQITETLPFRIRITNIGIESYGPNNPAPIGIAVIGISNYIL